MTEKGGRGRLQRGELKSMKGGTGPNEQYELKARENMTYKRLRNGQRPGNPLDSSCQASLTPPGWYNSLSIRREKAHAKRLAKIIGLQQ